MLEHLGEPARRAIAERWAIRDFRPQEIIVSQGSPAMGLWFVIDGFVRIERQHGARPVVLTFLQPGDVFGEMSWLEQEGASAAVVAETGGTKVALLRDAALDDLGQAAPAASAEIHRALATLLARRLRMTSARIRSSQSFDEATRGAPASEGMAPERPPSRDDAAGPGMSHDWTAEARALGARFREIRALSRRDPPGAATTLIGLMDEVVSMLARADASSSGHPGQDPLHAASDAIYPELLPFLVLSPALSRLQMVPSDQRHPSVYEQMLVLADPAAADPMGAALDQWAVDLPSCRAIRARRDALAGWLGRRLVGGREDGGRLQATGRSHRAPSRLALVGSGAAEALGIVLEASPDAVRDWQVAVIGPDEGPFARLESRLADGRCAAPPLFIEADPFYGDLETRLLPQDLVVTCGPADFCGDAAAARSLDWMAGQLAAGGAELVLATLSPELADLAFVQSVLGWPIHGLRPDDVARLAPAGRPPSPAVADTVDHGFHLLSLATPTDADGCGHRAARA